MTATDDVSQPQSVAKLTVAPWTGSALRSVTVTVIVALPPKSVSVVEALDADVPEQPVEVLPHRLDVELRLLDGVLERIEPVLRRAEPVDRAGEAEHRPPAVVDQLGRICVSAAVRVISASDVGARRAAAPGRRTARTAQRSWSRRQVSMFTSWALRRSGSSVESTRTTSGSR